MIHISMGSRLHVTLLDLGYATQRLYGGLGLAIDQPRTVLQGGESSRLILRGFRDSDQVAVQAAVRRLEGTLATTVSGDIRLVAAPPAHIGFGSRTSVVLSALALACRLSGIDVDERVLCKVSGRGGTSSIGMSVFVGHGGLLSDPGRIHVGRRVFLPSSSSVPPEEPVFARCASFPATWRVLLFLPRGRRLSGVAEAKFFAESTPMRSSDVRDAVAASDWFARSVGAVDIHEAALALSRISSTGFKRLEIANQPAVVGDAVRFLAEGSRLPVGMSSVGPLVYAIYRTASDDLQVLRRLGAEADLLCIGEADVSEGDGCGCLLGSK